MFRKTFFCLLCVYLLISSKVFSDDAEGGEEGEEVPSDDQEAPTTPTIKIGNHYLM